MPPVVARALDNAPYWFVIGGQAVRCFCPYRPSNDVHFGVLSARGLQSLVQHLRSAGQVREIERAPGTVHLSFAGIDVSIFVLPELKRYVENNSLDIRGLVATKLHAILDRGTRRDFFDLYVLLNLHKLGLIECIGALTEVYATDVNEGLVLRALTYFDDADREAPLPNEGASDWRDVQAYFSTAVASILLPPSRTLSIQSRRVELAKNRSADAGRRKRSARAVVAAKPQKRTRKKAKKARK